jgi:hypothetical protein
LKRHSQTRAIVTTTLLLLASCRGVEPVVPAPPRPVVTIDRVAGSNPLTVTGVANGSGTLELQVRDSRGRLMESSPIAPAHDSRAAAGTFENEVILTTDPGSFLVVEVVDSAEPAHGTLASMTSPADMDLVPRVLFFPQQLAADQPCDQVFALERRIPRTQSVARVLIEALIQGPTELEAKKGYSSPFPPGSAVRSLILRDGVATVDFNERLQNVGGSCRAAAIRSAVEQTLLALPAVRSVVITASGSRKLALQP